MKTHRIINIDSLNEFIGFTNEERNAITFLGFSSYRTATWLNELDDAAFENVCSLIAKCAGIKKINFEISPLEVGDDNRNIRFWQALKQLKNLEFLNFTDGKNLETLGAAGFSAFCDALKQYKLLQALFLHHTNISKLNLGQCAELGRAISECTALKILNLEMTELAKCGKDHLKALLNPRSNCLPLNLRATLRNGFDTASRETLIAYYDATSRLNLSEFHYIFDGNKLGLEDIRLLLSGFLQSCNLNTVFFELKNFPFSIVDEIVSKLSNHNQLEEITILLDSIENDANIDMNLIETTWARFEQFPILFNISCKIQPKARILNWANFPVQPINTADVLARQNEYFKTASKNTGNINRKNHCERLKAAAMALSGLAPQEDTTKPQNESIPTEIRYQILSYAFPDNRLGPMGAPSYSEGVDTSVEEVYRKRLSAINKQETKN